ncbi:MAG: OsmC family protein [Candidatus Methylomirabilales bacterium]
MGHDVTVRFLRNLQHEVLMEGHRLVADEPKTLGGDDEGPSPQMLLVGALGA